ncbi:hypothetical protein BH24ACT3_BH24ACT3_13260 [soil metagenome]
MELARGLAGADRRAVGVIAEAFLGPDDVTLALLEDLDGDGLDDDGRVEFIARLTDVEPQAACLTIPATEEEMTITRGAC